MKKFLLLTLLVATVSFASAQSQGDIRLSAGLALGTASAIDEDGSDTKMGVGINIGGEYLITDAISVSPSFTYFLKSTIGTEPNEITFRQSYFNLDGRYYFITGDLQAYGIAGIAIVSYMFEYPDGFGFFSGKFTDSEVGLNLGGGLVYLVSEKIGLNGQLKYSTPGFDSGQLVLNGGVVFKLN